MNRLLLFSIAFFVFSGCGINLQFSTDIENIQIAHWKESPYNTHFEFTPDDSIQIHNYKKLHIKYRAEVLNDFFDIIDSDFNSLQDTVYILEVFDVLCVNCPSFRLEILFDGQIFSYSDKKTSDPNIYEFLIDTNDFKYNLTNCELVEVMRLKSQKINWKADPLKYGWLDCHDGSFSYLTVFYPNNEIETMYVRCWFPFVYREE